MTTTNIPDGHFSLHYISSPDLQWSNEEISLALDEVISGEKAELL